MSQGNLDELPDFSQYLADDHEEIQSMADMLRSESDVGQTVDNRHGVNVKPTEADRRAISELASRLQIRHEPGVEAFNLKKPARAWLFSGLVDKRGTEAWIKRTNKRFLVLFNDCLLICDPKRANSVVLKQMIKLSDAVVEDMSWHEEAGGENCFAVITPQREYHFVCADIVEHADWLKQLRQAIHAWFEQTTLAHTGRAAHETISHLAWQHEKHRGTLWSAALLGNNAALAALLERAGDVDVRDPDGRTPLHLASFGGNLQGAQMLIARGADVDSLTDNLDTPLHYAAAGCAEGTMQFLLENGADIELKNMDDRSALFVCVIAGERSSCALRLLSMLKLQGADINETDTMGECGMHLCARHGYPRMTQLLAGLGADANIRRTRDGRTPIHVAASVLSPDPETLRALLFAGARPNQLDRKGKNSLSILLDPKRELNIAKKTARRRASELTGVAVPDNADDFDDGIAELANDDDDDTPEPVASPPPGTEISEEWVLSMLQPLLELCKRGARATEKLHARLPEMGRELMQKSQAQWLEKKEPENLLDYLPGLMPKVSEDRWVPDDASDDCQTCNSVWGMMVRRHHCRFCGALICGDCSRKKVTMYDIEPNSTAEVRL